MRNQLSFLLGVLPITLLSGCLFGERVPREPEARTIPIGTITTEGSLAVNHSWMSPDSSGTDVTYFFAIENTGDETLCDVQLASIDFFGNYSSTTTEEFIPDNFVELGSDSWRLSAPTMRERSDGVNMPCLAGGEIGMIASHLLLGDLDGDGSIDQGYPHELGYDIIDHVDLTITWDDDVYIDTETTVALVAGSLSTRESNTEPLMLTGEVANTGDALATLTSIFADYYITSDGEFIARCFAYLDPDDALQLPAEATYAFETNACVDYLPEHDVTGFASWQ